MTMVGQVQIRDTKTLVSSETSVFSVSSGLEAAGVETEIGEFRNMVMARDFWG